MWIDMQHKLWHIVKPKPVGNNIILKNKTLVKKAEEFQNHLSPFVNSTCYFITYKLSLREITRDLVP